MYPRSMADSDCVVVMGSNMAENHPVAFRWPMQAKVNGAKLIHVDPRFTRTSAMADIYALVSSLVKPPAERDETLRHPRCVFQIVKHHFSRYTPEMVERVTGCPRETFLKVARTLLDNSGPERTSSFAYAVAWTQHTNGPQIIGCAALLQLLLGNVGRPGAGIMALRGHASIQGSTDVPTLYHSIHGYMSHPSVLKTHGTLAEDRK